MGKSLTDLRSKLTSDATARARFGADVVNLLAAHGVDTDNPDVKKKLGTDLDAGNASLFGKSLAADGWAISIVSG